MMQTPYSFYYILPKDIGLHIYQMLKLSELVVTSLYSLTLVCVSGSNKITFVAGFTDFGDCIKIESLIEKHLDILLKDDNQDL